MHMSPRAGHFGHPDEHSSHKVPQLGSAQEIRRGVSTANVRSSVHIPLNVPQPI